MHSLNSLLLLTSPILKNVMAWADNQNSKHTCLYTLCVGLNFGYNNYYRKKSFYSFFNFHGFLHHTSLINTSQIEEHKGLMIQGAQGSGKTYLSLALANYLKVSQTMWCIYIYYRSIWWPVPINNNLLWCGIDIINIVATHNIVKILKYHYNNIYMYI